MTPEKRERLRKALFSVSSGKSTSLRKAADENDLSYSFLYRRWSGEVLFDLILYVHSTIFQLCGTGLPGFNQY